ncbi:MAG TPA: type VI secretion system baseplate subunit TssE [Steroidobacteraceae bacterium]|nr:type VI secretion system baseplate subunit TssE [Steroidobacteraceae bacterium]
MAPPDVDFLPSVLDRLLDDNPVSAARPRARSQQLNELRAAVRRDLEALMNAHQRCRSTPPELTELPRSLLEFGVPDFLTTNAAAASAREQFRESVEQAIRRFEPRFKLVKVTLLEQTPTDRTLRFRIEALMYAEPAPEHVSFDSLLDPSSQSFAVVGSA